MADNSQMSSGSSEMDYAEHDATYALFLKLIKYGMVLVIAIILFLAYNWG